MKWVLLLTLIGCKKEMVFETKDHVIYKNVNNESFEGRYYFPNGGMMELYNDHNGQINIISNNVVYPNSNGSLATINIPVTTKLEPFNNTIITSLISLTGANANVFIGNINGQASNGVQLSNTGTYRHKFKVSFNNTNKLVIELEIQQLISGSFQIVYLNTITEI